MKKVYIHFLTDQNIRHMEVFKNKGQPKLEIRAAQAYATRELVSPLNAYKYAYCKKCLI
jgi:hypothetical protein